MDEATQDQIILARSKLWTPELDKLLRKWKKNVAKRQKGHADLSRTYSKRHYIFGTPAVILSAIISAGIFSTFRNCSNCEDPSQDKCWIDQWIRIIVGCISLVAVSLTAFVTFMNYQQASEEHKTASEKYGALYRDLDSMLLIPGPVRGDPVGTLQTIRRQYEDITVASPNLPSKYNIDLSYEVSDTIKKNPPKPEDIQIDINDIKPNKKRKKVQNVSSTKELQEMLNRDIEECNDCDTSDDEVTIGIDLDAMPQSSNSDIARAIAGNNIIRENGLLNYEMQRLDNNIQTYSKKEEY